MNLKAFFYAPSVRRTLAGVVLTLVSGCSHQPLISNSVHHHSPPEPSTAAELPPVELAVATRVMQPSQISRLATLLPTLQRRRLIYVGETHTRYDHHLVQLAIIQALHQTHPDLRVAVEYFQPSYQGTLDAWIAGQGDEKDLLQGTDYYSRWGYDYRLYRPLFQFLREAKIPLIALNAPTELVAAVGKSGWDGVNEVLRPSLPTSVDRSDKDYETRLHQTFANHRDPKRDFQRFLDVQLLWDEYMAEGIVRLLQKGDGPLIVLAGTGHLLYGSGIPHRVARRIAVPATIVINGVSAEEAESGMGDYLLFSPEQVLPPPGQLGVFLDNEFTGDGVRIKDVATEGKTSQTGLQAGDRLITVAGQPVTGLTDIKWALLDHHPGDTVTVTLKRDFLWWEGNEQTLAVVLH